MKFLLPITFLIILASCKPSSEVFVRGIASTSPDGVLFIQECGTGTVFDLGLLASNPSFTFVSKLETLEVAGLIILDVMGAISPENPNKLMESQLINFSEGSCQIENT